jgi:hypothetical protein
MDRGCLPRHKVLGFVAMWSWVGKTVAAMSARPLILDRLDALLPLLHAGDFESADLLALFAPDVVREDRRSGLSADPAVGRSDLLNNMRVFAEFGHASTTAPVLEVRGSALALVHNSFVFANGYLVEFLQLAELNDAGQIANLVNLDVADSEAARGELELRWGRHPET